jgi:hypothetical protein
MTSALSQPIRFRERRSPLEAIAVYAEGAVAHALIEQLAAASGERIGALRGVARADCAVLLGPALELPWVDGVLYLGRDERAPQLLLPTYCEPELPCELLERRVLAAAQPPPIAVVPCAQRLVAVGQARALDRAALRAWLNAQRGAVP